MRNLFMVAAVLLAGCATQVPHAVSTSMSIADAQAAIERVLMEQPRKFRPQSVVFSNKFFGISNGMTAQESSAATAVVLGSGLVVANGSGESHYKELSTRVYYSSIGETKLYKKRYWRVVDVLNKDGRLALRTYTTNDESAHQFVDAIAVLSRTR